MAVGVYIDGFNFYFRLYKNEHRDKPVPARLKWLDLEKMASVLMPREDIGHISYFTAPVNPERDRGQAERQRAFLLALESLSKVEVVLGEFRWVHHRGTRRQDGNGTPEKFWHWEEKGSDVNIAISMVRDACQHRYDKLLLISNDSDLVGPVKLVTQELGVPVIQCSPDITINRALKQVATASFAIQPRRLTNCRLPDLVTTPGGSTVTCPPAWR